MSFFNELKRRNVFRVGLAFLVMSWLLLQIVDVVAPMLALPDWVPKLILLILAVGFIPALVFSWVFELTPDGLKRESEVGREESTTHHTAKRLDVLTIVLLAVVLGLFVFDRFMPDRSGGSESRVSDGTPAPAGQTVDDVSIAVLPFVNMSADPEQEFFSDGISEELLNVLAQFPGLRVAARTSAFQFKGQNRDIADIARQLRVNHVLEGSVRKSGDRLRITAQLIQADSGYHLWSESWDRDRDDIFTIQDEISVAIGEALQAELRLTEDNEMRGGAGTLPSVPAAASAQAYELYLKGRQLINGRGSQDLKEAVTVLEQALELDEAYSPAHAQLAIANALLLGGGGGTYGDLTMEQVLDRARPHIERAFELAPNLAEAFGARALLAQLNLDYPTAIENAGRALELNPSYVDAMNWRYLSLLNSSRWPGAATAMDHMLSVDPLSIVARINYSYALGRLQRLEEAYQVADDLARQTLRGSFVSHALIAGDYEGAIADSIRFYLKALALDPQASFSRARLAIKLSTVGMHEDARALLPEAAWLVNTQQRLWGEAVPQAQKRLDENPGNITIRMQFANVLHQSGDVAGAQPYFEEVLDAMHGVAIMDASRSSLMPTARLAWGRLAAGDAEGAEAALDWVREDFRARQSVGIDDSFMWRAAAMVSAMEGDREQLLNDLNRAIDTGLREDFIFHEPALAAFRDDPELLAIEGRLQAILAGERRKTLKMLCSDHPAPEFWPLSPGACKSAVRSR